MVLTQILLVEDDSLIAEIVQFYLNQSGKYQVTWASSGADALAQVGQDFDVILLDILLPDTDGITVCKQLRGSYRCPIIFLSCLDNSDTIVRALEMGGDDFIVKPFDNVVLEARIQANLRRVAMDREEGYDNGHNRGDLRLDAIVQELSYGAKTVDLSAIEVRLLSFLMDHPDEFFTAHDLYRKIWGRDSCGDIRTVQVHIHNVRCKLEKLGSRYTIKGVRGQGYSFCQEEEN